MTTERPVLSNLDRLNRNVGVPMKKFALGGSVPELMMKPRSMIFPVPPPFLPSFGSGLGSLRKRPFGPHM